MNKLDSSGWRRNKRWLFRTTLAVSFSVLHLSGVCPTQAAAFRPTGAMRAARDGHTATLLPNGKVLVAGGGVMTANELASAELYDPQTATWTVTGSMHTTRWGHTATLLTNGLVLVAGGSQEVGAPYAELYNPATETWTGTVPMTRYRFFHTATLLRNGQVLLAGGDSTGASAELYDPLTGTWAPTGPMTELRFWHSATLLPDGRVLVAGGNDYTGDFYDVSYTAELYDPVTRTWTPTGEMEDNRAQHTATLLTNGLVLVAGGWQPGGFGQSALPWAELYDPATETWTDTGSMVSSSPAVGLIGRFAHTATLLPDGSVLITGGEFRGGFAPPGSLYFAELYDPVQGIWKTTERMLTNREYHTATLLPSGEVLVAGGYFAGSDSDLSSAELCDPSAGGSWVVTGPLANPRRYHTATVLANGDVLVTGGWPSPGGSFDPLSSAERYDPAMRGWTPTEDIHYAREFHTATLLQDGRVLVAGGEDAADWPAATELFDPASGAWTLSGDLNFSRESHTATLLTNGQVLVAGGYCGGAYLTSAELYDPASGGWSTTGSLNEPHASHTATLLPSGKVLVAGGTAAELYDPDTGTWTDTGSMGTAHVAHTATLLPNGRVLVAGGTTNSPFSAEIYDPATGIWTATGSMRTPRSAHTATLLGSGRVLIAGGNDGRTGEINSAELFDPATGLWTPAADLNFARFFHTAALLPDGRVLVAGGATSRYPYTLSSAEIYEPGAGTAPVVQPVRLTDLRILANGSFQLNFTNTPGAAFRVLAAANLAPPANNWTLLGRATEISPGQFQFTDPQATNYGGRFYRTLSP